MDIANNDGYFIHNYIALLWYSTEIMWLNYSRDGMGCIS